MADIESVQGDFSAVDARYAIVAARFYEEIADSLMEGACATLKRHGVDNGNIRLIEVPGAFELPLATDRVIHSAKPDAVIALGAVIRGQTPHFGYVCRECARGLGQIGIATGIPVIFGVLTTNTREEAMIRAGMPLPGRSRALGTNKGAEAALSAMKMVALLRKL